MKKSLFSWAAAAVLALSSLPSLADTGRTEAGAKPGGTLRVAIERWPNAGLLPQSNNWVPLFANQFESLVKADNDENFHPWLAKSWEISDDGRTYTFTLRDDVVFQDGDKFNAEAVKTTFDILLPGGFTLTPPRRSWAGAVDSVEVVDEYTVRLHLNRPDATLLNSLSTLSAAIASPTSIRKPDAKQGGLVLKGTGPFELVEVVPDQKLVYRRFDKYNWATATARHDGPAYLERLELNVVPDAAVRVGLLSSGQVDLVTTLGPDDIPLFKGDPNYVFIARSGNTVPWAWYFNTKGFGTDDVRVREAFREALDLDTLVAAIFRDTGKHAWSQLVPRAKFYDAKYEGSYGNNVKRANALLDEAGWNGRNAEGVRTNAKGEALELSLLDRGFSGRERLFTEAVQQTLLDKAGIKLVVETVDEAQGFVRRDKADYSVFHVSVAGHDVGYSLNLLWPTGGVINFSHLSDPQVDAWNKAQLQALDNTERREYIDKIVDYALNEQKLVLPIVETFHNVAAGAHVKNSDTSFGALRNYTGPIAYDIWLSK